jgi:hypothetical protein
MARFEDRDLKTIPCLSRTYGNHNTMQFTVGLNPNGSSKGPSVLIRVKDTGGTRWLPRVTKDMLGNEILEVAFGGGAELNAVRELSQFILDALDFLEKANSPESIQGVTIVTLDSAMTEAI